MGVMSYEETLDVSCMAVTPACSKGALGTWRSQCSARTLSRDHAAFEEGTSSLVNRRGRCVCRSVLKLRRESGKTHEGKPRSEPDWGNPTVRDRRGACGIVVSMGAGLRPNGKLLDRPPDPAVTCAPHFYPDHMREKLKPMLFDDEYVEQARATRPSPVAKARRSDQAKAKDATKLSEDGLPVHSFRTLLDDLATLAYNVCHTPLNPDAKLVMTTRPTPVQEKAFRLLNINPACTQ